MAIFKNPVGLPMPCCCSCVRGREAESHCCASDQLRFMISSRADCWAFAQPGEPLPVHGTLQGPGTEEPPILPNDQAIMVEI